MTFAVEIIILIVTGIVGGGTARGFLEYRQAKKTKAEIEVLGLKTPVEVESLQIAGMDTLIKNLQEDNNTLRADRDYWRDMYETVKAEVDSLAKEMDEYRARIDHLQQVLASAGRQDSL